jgi:maternal embryonic leucine zipper kinase
VRDERQARTIFRDLVCGLAYMHSEGFAHRDLKPENMLFNETRALKLIDLGLVSMPGEDLTRTSCGSANYAAPEVIQGDRYHSPTGDLWSLGTPAWRWSQPLAPPL